jgi:hypothetical protein
MLRPVEDVPDEPVLRVRVWQWKMRFLSEGPLVPWLGPALRGVVADRFKNGVCKHDEKDRAEKWKYCDGCSHLSDCAYGSLFEPDAASNPGPIGEGQEVPRPVVLSPGFPAPEVAMPGMSLPVRMLVVGPYDAASSELITSLQDPSDDWKLGPSHVRFVITGSPSEVQSFEFGHGDFASGQTARTGTVPGVRVRLLTPLFLREKTGSGARRSITIPSFADLLRASLRVIGLSAAVHGHPLDANYQQLKIAAQSVQLVSGRFRPFSLVKRSNRQQARFRMHGVVGEGLYSRVPASLLPWIDLGGRLHVGTHRVSGAGSWTVALQ